jgi:photosystem II stability/assembly factor-like uncharacterized protein
MQIRFAAVLAVLTTALFSSAITPLIGQTQTQTQTRARDGQPRPARVAGHPTPSAEPTPDPGLQYRSIGPTNSGGRVAAVTGSDLDPMLYYAGAAGGGVWKSSNGGISWTSVWKKQPLGAIGALAIDPHDDASVWAGTGEANPRNDVSWGDGLWHSRDGGKTWLRAGLRDTSQIARISLDPDKRNELVVAALGDPWRDSAERGVYRSTDGGATWNKTLFVDATTGAADLARDPHDPMVLYASMWRFRRTPWYFSSGGGTSDGLYKSRDGGATWQQVRGHGFPDAPLGRIGVAIAPSRPSRVYAVVQSSRGTIWRSDDAGTTWQVVSSNTLPEQRPFYFSHLAVDPRNPDHVIAVSMYLTESKDGGRTWKHFVSSIHVDNHAFWWSHDGRRIINGNDGGIAYSNDSGKTWAMPLDLAIGQIYHVGFDTSDPYTVCGGFQDNSSWCGPSNSRNGIGILERDWTAIAGGDGEFAIPDPGDPTKIWTDTQDGSLGIFSRATQQSVDVSPWPNDPFTSRAGISDKLYRFNWDSPLAFAPSDPHTAYFGGNVVFKTTDGGATWVPLGGDLTRNEKTHQIASGGPISLDVSGAENYDTLLAIAPARADPQTIWAGSDDGLVHVSRDGGTTWADVTPPGLPRYARVESIDASGDDAKTAYLALDRHDLGDREPYLFATADSGTTWRRIDAGLPRGASTHVIRVDPKDANRLYTGTEQGVWTSPDRGHSWQPLQFNLPAAPVYDLAIQPQANDLIVATHGRSFWILDDLTPIQMNAAIGRAKPVLFPLRPGTLWAQWPPVETGDGNSLPDNFPIGANPKGPALVTFWQTHLARTRPSIEILDGSGSIVRHLSGSYLTDDGKKYWVSNAAGYNRLAWDGMEDGPVRWTGTSLQNAGPLTGAEALPGTYTIRLTIDGRTFDQPFTLKADPRNPWTADELRARHAYLAQLYADVSQIDVVLNAIDSQERRLRAKHHDGKASVRIAALDEVRQSLTANDLHDEDSIAKPDRIRESLFGAAGNIGGSFQPPTAAHLANAAALQAEFERTIGAAKGVVYR